MQQVGITLLRSGYRFVCPTPETQRRVNARPGNGWAANPVDIFGWSRPFRRDALPVSLFAQATEAGMLVADNGAWRSRFRFSTLGGNGFFHSAFPTVAADAVFFGPDSYRFGAVLAAHLRSAPPPVRAVDIGCGTGLGAIMIAQVCPSTEVVMVDINPDALRLARINVGLAGVGGIMAWQGDLLSGLSGAFDLIISNPPYLPDPGCRLYRDGGGRLGAGLSLAIVRTAMERLTPGGTLLLYTGTAIINGDNPFLRDVVALLDGREFTWAATELDPDVFGEELENGPLSTAERIAVICLTVTRR
ncbi:class I SAM-dependent methyltransferase [Komagataeibacter intermedius]|uniref:Methyltransferase small domain-containing protein n=9 Tax=Acetobacteraceae TaxID=433 RepID=A0A2S3VYQ8_9PROT|nr:MULTISPECIES: class I SAM-dependent methyltransferase [Acetobacteraceae]AHI27579.1 Putative adenine-specific methylase [Komagataeibacter xylinus E25]MBL7237426.1 class I SAM-dependent methyltransferase [Novacetimonas hansenii]ARW18455.1 16S rRNA (guanine(1207)-N(2))-methyltransferase [Komagataeibacter europaeus]KPH85371.1 SAM-dependent methyltransferase [Komagataeibacter intermedius AF2]MBV0889491.1 class I SAM-dependent methyltransferase [Komagataeibacter oboediens]